MNAGSFPAEVRVQRMGLRVGLRHFPRDPSSIGIEQFYRDLAQMMGERGVPVDHSTIYRWVQKYAPEIESWPEVQSSQALDEPSVDTSDPSGYVRG